MRRIMIDETKCDGCRNCEVACMQAHRSTPGSIYDLDLTSQENESRNHIVRMQDGSYRPIFCRHCDQPECVMSCMSGALHKDPETGLVLYDEKKCGSCFMCVMNCPYGVLKPDAMTRTRILKCDFCTSAGTEPSCVAACPKKAIYLIEGETPVPTGAEQSECQGVHKPGGEENLAPADREQQRGIGEQEVAE